MAKTWNGGGETQWECCPVESADAELRSSRPAITAITAITGENGRGMVEAS